MAIKKYNMKPHMYINIVIETKISICKNISRMMHSVNCMVKDCQNFLIKFGYSAKSEMDFGVLYESCEHAIRESGNEYDALCIFFIKLNDLGLYDLSNVYLTSALNDQFRLCALKSKWHKSVQLFS